MQTGGPESITISDSTFSRDLGERACTYREFFRQSDIYQKWKIKIEPPLISKKILNFCKWAIDNLPTFSKIQIMHVRI